MYENLVYIYDNKNFFLKCISKYENININTDVETNSKTQFSVLPTCKIENKDFVFIKKDGKIKYKGIVDDKNNQGEKSTVLITCKDISNLFDEKIILDEESIIKEKGIEDFILHNINKFFTQSEDTFLNIKFLDVEILTHTKIQKSIETVNNIYNFHTFLINCQQNYNINYDFEVKGKRLKLIIYNSNAKNHRILDTNISDIVAYEEIFNNNVISKVVILCANGLKHSFFLKNDRSITEDMLDINRAEGKTEILYADKSEDAKQLAYNTFKRNSYEHMIKFKINKNSKLYNVNEFRIGDVFTIKTQKNMILESCITAIKDNEDNFLEITFGKIRQKFIDKIMKERNDL